MADKKTVKKQPKVADYTSLSQDELQKLLLEKQADLSTAKRSHASRELVNPRVLTTTRKEIARIHTAIRANQAKESN